MANEEATHGQIMEKIVQLEARCDDGCGNVFTKRFPLGGILAIALQTFGIIWWAAGIDNTLTNMKTLTTTIPNEDQVKNYIAEREKKYMDMDSKRHLGMSERVSRVEGNFKFIEKSLNRIEKKLMLIGKD